MEEVNKTNFAPRDYRNVSSFCGGATAILGVLGLFAWISGLRLFSSIASGYIPMAADTGMIFVLFGLVLFLSLHGALPEIVRASIAVLLALAAFYGLLKSVEYLVKADLTFEKVLFPIEDSIGAYPINRMSPLTGALFVLAGIALLPVLRNKGGDRARDLAGSLGLTVAVAGFIATIGYVFGTPLLYGGDIIPLAATTAFAFLLLGIGLVAAAGPAFVLLRPFTGPSIRARMLRAFLPLTALVVLAQGFLNEVIGEWSGLNHAVLSAGSSLVFAAITAAVVMQMARAISRTVDVAEVQRKDAEDALRQERNLLRTLIDNLPDQIFAKDTKSKFILNNTSYALANGTVPEALLGKTDLEIRTPEMAARFQEEDQAVIQSGAAMVDRDELAVDPSGKEHWYLTTKVPLRDGRGQTIGVVGIKRDITARKRVEEEMRLFAKIFESTAEGIMITDDRAIIISTNPAFSRITGYTSKQAIGQTPALFQRAGQDSEYFGSMWRSLMEAGQWQGEMWSLRPDGAGYQAWVTINGVRTESGELTHYVGVISDITDRKRAEQALESRNRELALLNRAGQIFNSSLNLDQVLIFVLNELDQQLRGTGSFWLIDPQSGELVCRQASGPNAETVRGWKLRPGQGIAGWVAQHGESLIVPDASRDERHTNELDRKTGMPARSILAVPLKSKQCVIGVLELMDSQVVRFGEPELALVESLAATATIAIDNARLYEDANRLRAFNENIIQSMDESVLLEDESGHIAFVNPRVSKMLHYEPDELIGRHWSVLIPPELTVPVMKEASLRPEGIASRYEAVLVTKEGQRVPVIVSARPLFENSSFAGVLSVFTDITERKRGEEELKASESRYRELFAAASRQSEELSLLTQVRTVLAREVELPIILRSVVEAISGVFGYTHVGLVLVEGDDAVLKHQVGYDHLPDRLPITKGIIGRVIRSGQPVLREDVNTDEDFIEGNEGTTSEVCVPLFERGAVVGALNVESRHGVKLTEADLHLMQILSEDISIAIGQARLYAEVQRLAITDDLTGASNRRHFFDLGAAEFGRARRLGHPLCAIMIDIDHFKRVNDEFGHAVGDQVLRELGERMRRNVREVDILGRYGGEEFIILLPGADADVALQIAERLRQHTVDTPVSTRREKIAVTLSVGVAIAGPDTPDLATLIDVADRAMYAAKQAGRNRVAVAP